ncbi:MAG: polysaccharide deacetylase family protein [Isosphaeraceae bacterium]
MLTYHGVGARGTVTTVARAWFLETLAALRAGGFHSVDLADWVARGRPDEPRGFAIGFDDGLASILGVVEALGSFGFTATVFLPAGRVGLDNDWPGQPGWVHRERLIDWDEAAGLASLGWGIAAHGWSHRPLDRCPADELDRETRGARHEIEQRLARPCPLFAYPYGACSSQARRAVSRHFGAGFGTRLGYATSSEHLYGISRDDAYYLDTRPTHERLVRDAWRAGIGVRRALRSVRRAAGALSWRKAA